MNTRFALSFSPTCSSNAIPEDRSGTGALGALLAPLAAALARPVFGGAMQEVPAMGVEVVVRIMLALGATAAENGLGRHASGFGTHGKHNCHTSQVCQINGKGVMQNK